VLLRNCSWDFGCNPDHITLGVTDTDTTTATTITTTTTSTVTMRCVSVAVEER